LLFGSPIQFLWIPKEGDTVFDVLYTIGLAVFILDMIFNLLVDPEYFGCNYFWRRVQQPHQPKRWTCGGVGSFMFWCDVVSTLALCHDISYINQKEYEMLELNLKLNKYGIPVSTPFRAWIDQMM
jgi:hypothetical protein